MPSTVLRTKTNLPALRQQRVPRTRILDAIASGVRHARKLTLISAPAGFGKSTLARAWVETSGLPTAWLTLDEGDAEPQRFLTYLVTALQAVIAGVGEELLRALAAAQPPALEILLASLLNELAVVEDAFVLVLDDYHLATSGPVDALLNLLVQHLPTPMHLLITTREDPPLPLARLRARNQLMELRAADLRVDEREAAEFLDQVMGLREEVLHKQPETL